ncbi:MAG: tyrosine-type recombinase/integrase [Candidatus Methanoperedens sp.]
MKYKSIEEFLSYYANKNTKNSRKSGLLAFIEFVSSEKRKSGSITEKELVEFERHLKKYMSIKKRDYYDDLLKFAVYMSSKGIPPLTARAYISTVREYFGQFGIEFSGRQIKDIRNKSPKGGSRTEEDDLTKDIIKQIIQYTDVRGRALFLTLISTGMRIGECLQLNLNDLNIKDGKIVIPTILIRGHNTKTGEQRYTFLNKEAIHTLEAYLLLRERYMETTFKRGGRVIERKEEYKNRLFPFSDVVALQIFSTALQKAGLEKFSSSIQRRTFHIHMFRKYFRSQLAVGCPVDVVEALMGHNGYLTASYRKYTKEQMYEYFQKAEHFLYINEIDINKLESEYRKELEVSNQLLKARIDEIEQQRKKDMALNEDLIKVMIEARVKEMLKKPEINI